MPACKHEALPRRLLPMLATSAAPFDDPAYLFETKWDGVRALASVDMGRWRLWGRAGTVYTERYPELAALRRFPKGTIVDGELVVIRDGRADFHAVMSRHSRRPRRLPFFAEPVRYVIFDLLYLRGRSLMQRPFAERRAQLHEHLVECPYVTFCRGVVGKGQNAFRAALAAGHEGVVAKHLNSTYVAGKRTATWQKIKESLELPCVVIGYRAGSSGRRAVQLASLVKGKLCHVGAVDLGVRGDVLKRLETLRSPRPAIACSATAQWVKPEQFCIVRFAGWRPDGSWRDPVIASWETS